MKKSDDIKLSSLNVQDYFDLYSYDVILVFDSEGSNARTMFPYDPITVLDCKRERYKAAYIKPRSQLSTPDNLKKLPSIDIDTLFEIARAQRPPKVETEPPKVETETPKDYPNTWAQRIHERLSREAKELSDKRAKEEAEYRQFVTFSFFVEEYD